MLSQILLEWVLRKKQKSMKVDENYSVSAYLERIPVYFDPAKAPNRKMTVVYEIHDSGDRNGVWSVTVANGKCLLSKGEPERYDTKLYMTAEVYRRVLTGRLDISKLAYSTGAIRFYGNSLGHRELNAYLSIPKNAGVAAL